MTNEQFVWISYGVITIAEMVILTVKLPLMIRRAVGATLILLLAAVHAQILLQEPLAFGIPFVVIGLYRIFNVMRFSYGRMHALYLYKATRLSSLAINGYQIVIVIAYLLLPKLGVLAVKYLYVTLVVQSLAYWVLIYVLHSNIKRSSANITDFASSPSSVELPTVTIAIPARNETTDLEECLRSIVSSDYKKLEILVLDDCSQERVSYIIKSFAHEGVRFVQGDEPGDTWLPKNAAYQKLLHEATGDIIVFCGVDVRIATDTISKIVSCMSTQSLQMLSILPERSQDIRQSNVIQLVRYIWELALPRQALRRPPVLSTFWAIDRNKLLSFGGFSSVKRMIVPESYFARICAEASSYRFLLNNELGIVSLKSAQDQRSTAVRVRYPQLHKSPEILINTTLVLIFVFILPYLSLIYGLVTKNNIVWIASMFELILQIIFFWLAVDAVTLTKKFIHLLFALMVPVTDIYLMHWSMYVYEFGEVNWKQRNVCLPVMHVTPSLPKIEN